MARRVLALVVGGFALATLAVVIGVNIAGASISQDATGEELEGEIFSFGITVPTAPVTIGDTIVFPNNSELPHTITDRGGTFDTGEIAPGSTNQVTFDTPGRFEIFCQINPSTMNAVVEVLPGDDPPLRQRIQLYDEFREGETRRFDPNDLEVALGTELTIANVGGLEHTYTAEDGAFDTGTVAPGLEQGRFAGASATLVADKPGTFTVFCEFHPEEIRGTLVVLGDPADEDEAPPDDAEAPDDDVGDEAAAAAPADDSNSSGIAAAAVVVLLGLGAIVLVIVAPKKTKARSAI